MQSEQPGRDDQERAFRVSNRAGSSPYLFVCEHASNHVPARFGSLGLSAGDLERHIAWDPGAAPVARRLSQMLDAALIESTVSRLVIDCNRPLDAPDLIGEVSETTPVPGNAGLSAEEREERVALAYRPFHDALDAMIAERLAEGRETRLVSVHSFTPVYKGVERPWQVGILHDDDTRLAAPLIAALSALWRMNVGDNEPYSPRDRVYHTLETHGRVRGLACAMIEIRNDEIADAAGQHHWADMLGAMLAGIDPAAGGGRGRAEEVHLQG